MSRRWITAALGDDAFERLARGMSGTELWSLLMEVARERARERSPAQVLAQHRRDAFVQPAPVDQRTLLALDAELFAAAAAFEGLELSPVAPLGATSTIAPTDQHRVLSALRGTEVVSDPTNVLALECAARLTRAPDDVVRLATSQRVVRAQALPNQPGHTRHFRLFALASAGREVADHGLLVSATVEQVRTQLAGLERLESRGYAFGARRVDVLATPWREDVGRRVAAELTEVPTALLPLEHAYYSGGLRFMLWVTEPGGAEVPIGDGGAFDWLTRLGANRRLRFVASGLGSQLAALRFRRP